MNKKIFLFLLALNYYSITSIYAETIEIIASEDNIEQLLALDPNNVDFLSIYAIKQQRDSNYLGAIETFERIVELYPTLLPFYLELARLQFFTHDYKASEENFLYVYRQDIPPNVRFNIRHYLRQIERLNPTKINYNFKISYNDNINNGTYADTIRLFGIPFQVDESAKAKESYELFTDINGAYDFILDDHKLKTGFLINHSNFSGSAYDRLKYGANIGPEHYFKNQRINWTLSLSKEEMNNDPVANLRELRVSDLLNIKPNIQLQTTIGINETDYYNNANYNADGKFIDLLVNYIDKKNINYSVNLKFTDNDAQFKPYGNEKIYLSSSIASQLPKGFYGDLTIGIEEVDYDAYQLMWLTTREDQLKFASFNLRNDRIYLGNFYPQINITLRDNTSNVDVYRTSSDSLSVYLIKDF